MLLGVLGFVALYLSTSYFNSLPPQLLLLLGIAFGLAGSSIMLKLERTYVWKVLACAFVGSVLFTDAIGLSQLNPSFPVVQYLACAVLVLLSSYHQVEYCHAREMLGWGGSYRRFSEDLLTIQSSLNRHSLP